MGVSLAHVERRQELASVLGHARTTPLLVYCGAEDSTAQDILDWLDHGCVRRPVLFLVDHSDFSQYYGLMSRGACDYFEVSDAPERIVCAIKRAAAGRVV